MAAEPHSIATAAHVLYIDSPAAVSLSLSLPFSNCRPTLNECSLRIASVYVSRCCIQHSVIDLCDPNRKNRFVVVVVVVVVVFVYHSRRHQSEREGEKECDDANSGSRPSV